MAREAKEAFPGFPDFRANVTFTPIQYFTVVVPHCSRGTVRIVGYVLRKVLGWVDERGNPTREQLQFTYRELIEKAGVSRESIPDALREAVDKRFLRCVQSPLPDRIGQPARNGIYEIYWDKEGRYTNSPVEFRGFFYPEAAMMEEQAGSRVVSRPKAARKNIPNAFFDELLPCERLSVIRAVGALLFYSSQWGPGGERKVPVSKSITELSRLSNLSRQHIHGAVTEARERGYIIQVDAGCFDPAAGKDSRAATYAIHWAASAAVGRVLRTEEIPTQPAGKIEREQEQSVKVDGAPVGKSERHETKMVNGERSNMVNDIRIKKELKNLQTTASASYASDESSQKVAAESGFDLLCKAGFDERTARRLARKRSPDVIQRQIQWLAQRGITRNRLGFLCRAIEQNWPQPESGESANSFLEPARQFASHYYAGYHGFTGAAATEPFAKDIGMASKFIPRLLSQEPSEALIPQWGQRFGRLMRDKHQGDLKAKPNLSFALVLFGDKFLRLLQCESAACRRKALGEAREAHQKAFTSPYIVYLRLVETELQKGNPSVYGDFAKHRERLRHLMTSGPFLASAERLSNFGSEESRLLDFAAFFQQHPKKPVLSFWEWDARLNPQRFGSGDTATLPQQEALT